MNNFHLEACMTNKKFNIRTFYNLSDKEKIIDYAKNNLLCLGQGSSRIVFAFSYGKALKIALNEKGYGQNAAELTISQNKETQNAIAKIYDYKINDEKKVLWLISEITRTINDIEEFKKLSGFSWEVYTDVIRSYIKTNGQIENAINDITNFYIKRIEQFKKQDDKYNAKYYENLLSEIKKIKSSDFFSGIIAAIKTHKLMSGDILEIDHYGKTTHGTIVLLDYGFTEEIAKKYYINQNDNIVSKKPSDNIIYMPIPTHKNEIVTRNENKIKIKKKAI